MSKWKEEHLSYDHFRIIGDFECGPDDPLNTFLSDKAIDYDEQRLGTTYLLLNGNQVIAYYTIKANGIQVHNEETGEFDSVPVIEIARIAVSYELQGNGLGKQMFYDYILPRIDRVAKEIAIQAIMVFVEAENNQGIRFYESVGFKKADETVQRTISESFNEECDLYLVQYSDISLKERE